MSYVTHTIIDHSGETSPTRHQLPEINAGNYDAVTGNGPLGNVGELRLALAELTQGNFVKHEVTATTFVATPAPAPQAQAQRETKLLMRFRSSAGRAYSVEIPAPILTNIAVAGTDVVDLSADATWDGVKDMIQTSFTDSYGDTLTTFVDARIVGRRL